MLRIDAHQHFWKYDPQRDSWIDESMQVLRQDYLPTHLEPLLYASGFYGCVVVQSAQNQEENLFQLSNCFNHSFVKGVVGWVDLQSSQLEWELAELAGYAQLKGFRHILQGEADRALMLSTSFRKGIETIGKAGYTYDLLVLPDQLRYAAELVADFPDQKFVLDHIGKPPIKSREIDVWRRDIQALAKYPNVFCKVSGLVTEADLSDWELADFRPYLDVVFEAFGAGRVIFGSDWPVCLLVADYQQVVRIMEHFTTSFSPDEKAQFWGGNATDFYNLNID